MNIVSKILMVNIETDITLHNGSITMTVIHQVHVYELGIEFQSMVNDECRDLISDQDIEYLKTLYIK